MTLMGWLGHKIWTYSISHVRENMSLSDVDSDGPDQTVWMHGKIRKKITSIAAWISQSVKTLQAPFVHETVHIVKLYMFQCVLVLCTSGNFHCHHKRMMKYSEISSGPSLSANRIIEYRRKYEWRAKTQMILFPYWSEIAHFAHIWRHFFA